MISGMFRGAFPAILVASAMAFAQAPAPPAQKDAAAEKLSKQTWQRINSYGELLSALTETPARVRGLARLGSIVCRQDALFARMLFERAYAALRVGEETGEIKPGTRSFLISRVNQCDTVLARGIIESAPTRKPSESDTPAFINLRSAMDLISEDPTRAVELGEKAINGDLTDIGVEFLSMWLHRLKEKDEEAANRLFLQAVQQMVGRPVLNVNDLVALGLYLFTSPGMARDGITDGAMKGFAAGMPMTNVTAVRTGVLPEVARAYLDAAITVLTRPVDDPQQKALYHAAAVQLLPHAQQFGVDRVALLDAAMRALREQIPPDPRRDLNRNSMDDTKDLDQIEAEKKIDELAGADERDARWLQMASFMIFRKRFGRAREVADKIADAELRRSVIAQVDFAEGADALRQKQVARAVEKAEVLPAGIERALLLLGIAAAQTRTDQESASARIFEALEIIRAIEEDRRGWVMLSAAAVQTPLNWKSALATFSHAIAAINRSREAAVSGRVFSTEIKRGRITRFYLDVPGVTAYDFAAVLPPLADRDFAHVEATVRNLTNQELLAQTLPLLAREALKKLK